MRGVGAHVCGAPSGGGAGRRGGRPCACDPACDLPRDHVRLTERPRCRRAERSACASSRAPSLCCTWTRSWCSLRRCFATPTSKSTSPTCTPSPQTPRLAANCIRRRCGATRRAQFASASATSPTYVRGRGGGGAQAGTQRLLRRSCSRAAEYLPLVVFSDKTTVSLRNRTMHPVWCSPACLPRALRRTRKWCIGMIPQGLHLRHAATAIVEQVLRPLEEGTACEGRFVVAPVLLWVGDQPELNELARLYINSGACGKACALQDARKRTHTPLHPQRAGAAGSTRQSRVWACRGTARRARSMTITR